MRTTKETLTEFVKMLIFGTSLLLIFKFSKEKARDAAPTEEERIAQVMGFIKVYDQEEDTTHMLLVSRGDRFDLLDYLSVWPEEGSGGIPLPRFVIYSEKDGKITWRPLEVSALE